MSDTADDIGFQARQLLNKTKTDTLRQKMREFVEERDETDLKDLRQKVASGDDLSDVVSEGRRERL
jgi:ribosomal protein S3AE